MLEDPIRGRRAPKFTIQWHLTLACDLHCKHCYDRTNPRAPRREQAMHVLDELERFCDARGVKGSVSLSGGNPFFYRWFFDVYESAWERGFPVSILGNPVTAEQLDRLVAIRKPTYFQVSLEGLEEHNDHIRGSGNFERVLEFLPLLEERDIPSAVMTTLTRDNADQLVPLGRLLRGKTRRFTFNRLAQVGEGAALGDLGKREYGELMVEYLAAREQDRTLFCKDNLFNIFRHELELPLFNGCTGYGCGAAFNFVAILPSGEVHACRKFPSPLGNVFAQSLETIYDSAEAERYRRGSTACDECPIRAKCGGCLAVAHGHGLDPFTDRDPHCFMYD